MKFKIYILSNVSESLSNALSLLSLHTYMLHTLILHYYTAKATLLSYYSPSPCSSACASSHARLMAKLSYPQNPLPVDGHSTQPWCSSHSSTILGVVMLRPSVCSGSALDPNKVNALE